MISRLIYVIAISIVLLGTPVKGHAVDRVALVIGNSTYQNAPELTNPRNDAFDMVKRLRELDFQVVQGIDLDLRGLRNKIKEFINQLGTAKLALFYYAGHGLQVNGKNYLVPIDATLDSYLDLDFEAVPMDLVLNAMEEHTDTNILFLDACRNNPLSRNLARSMGKRSTSIGRGLARIGASKGTLISFATQPGNVALDGTGRNSPFATALVKHLGTPGDSIIDSLIRVRKEVIKITKGEQVPWEHSSLTGRVVLQEKPVQPVFNPSATTNLPNSNITVELAYWDTIKNANTSIYYEIYLKRYPKGIFADIAKLKILEIKGPVVEKEKIAKEKIKAAEASKKIEQQTASLKQQKNETPTPTAPVVDRSLTISDRESVKELQQRLYDLNFDPGIRDGVMGKRTRVAISEYQSSSNREKSGKATIGLLESLREAKVPDNWGGLEFRPSNKRVYERSQLPNRKSTEAELAKACRGCQSVLVFSGDECGGLAMSSNGWGWAVRKSKTKTESAAMASCKQYGSGCKLQALVCADGS